MFYNIIKPVTQESENTEFGYFSAIQYFKKSHIHTPFLRLSEVIYFLIYIFLSRKCYIYFIYSCLVIYEHKVLKKRRLYGSFT